MTPGDLQAAVERLLAEGLEPEDVDRVRRRLGDDAPPAAVVRELAGQSRLPLRDAPTGDPSVPPGSASRAGGSSSVPAGSASSAGGFSSVPAGSASRAGGSSSPRPAGVVDQVLVCGLGMPDGLAATWPAGGPLWVRVRGTPAPPGPAVAVVGTRRPTLDGLRLAEGIAAGLAVAGVVVVSGLARGIDQAAHRAALTAGGRSTAVIGTGHDVDYPAGTADLRRALAGRGGIVSEYAPGRGVRRPQQFLARNRILAGLADAVVVVEAGARSGALSTAGWALRYGRDVLVVPSSPSNRAAAGSLALLVDGATPVRGAPDVLDALGLTGASDVVAAAEAVEAADVLARAGGRVPGAPAPDGLDGVTTRVLALLSSTPSSPSALAHRTGCSPREVLVAISVLEDRGLAARDGGGVVRAG